MKKYYNKLVRDSIPYIIAENGKTVVFRKIEGEELKTALKNKLTEEVNELINAKTRGSIIEEIVDIRDILHKIQVTLPDIPIEDSEILACETAKLLDKGKFHNNYFLISAEDDAQNE